MVKRKIKNIKVLTNKDVGMLKAFSNVGYLKINSLNHNLNISTKRIKNFIKDGYIQKVYYLCKDTKDINHAYRLTEKGKGLCQNYVGVKYFYKSSSPRHDLALAEKYFSINQSERENWVTEIEWRDRFCEYLDKLQTQDVDRWEELASKWESHQISPPDGGFISEGREVAIEILTSNYGNQEIDAKEEFVELMAIEYEPIKI